MLDLHPMYIGPIATGAAGVGAAAWYARRAWLARGQQRKPRQKREPRDQRPRNDAEGEYSASVPELIGDDDQIVLRFDYHGRCASSTAPRWAQFPLELLEPASLDIGDDRENIEQAAAIIQNTLDTNMKLPSGAQRKLDQNRQQREQAFKRGDGAPDLLLRPRAAWVEGVTCTMQFNRIYIGRMVGVKAKEISDLRGEIVSELGIDGAKVQVHASVMGRPRVVAVDLPRENSSVIGISALLSHPAFVKNKGQLPICFAVQTDGTPLVFDLAKAPHIVNAGATQSGKSVTLNNIIMSLIYRFGPRDLQMVMIDGKRVELKPYYGIPHLTQPIITSAEDALKALRAEVEEVKRRTEILDKAEVRNIAEYNAIPGNHMPYRITIIDEWAMMYPKCAALLTPAEEFVQAARATGQHMVLTLQSPRAKVLPDLLNDNTPFCICHRVKNMDQSQIVLGKGEIGGKDLRGHGDMLVSHEDGSPVRAQGALTTTKDVGAVVKHLRQAA